MNDTSNVTAAVTPESPSPILSGSGLILLGTLLFTAIAGPIA